MPDPAPNPSTLSGEERSAVNAALAKDAVRGPEWTTFCNGWLAAKAYYQGHAARIVERRPLQVQGIDDD